MHALDALAFVLETQPELGQSGRVLFMRAQPSPVLARFEGRLTCEQTWKPRAAALTASGVAVTKDPTGTYDTIFLLPERQRETVLADIAKAHDLLAEGGTLVVALHNDWGAKRTEQQLAEICGGVETVSKHHSRVFWTTKSKPWKADKLAVWRDAAALRRILDGRFWTCPGLFHWDEIDAGSRLLTEHLPVTLSGAVADLGCSWGFLSDHLLRSCPNLRSLDCYEADSIALECARRNLGLVPCPIRPRLHWTDVTAGLGKTLYDVIVMNPPFHDGRDADPMLGLKFITTAAMSLRSTGDLWLVANKHLPYENLMAETFEFSTKVIESGGFKILHGARPKAVTQMHRRKRR
jgi:16S rRNA (guanine1207-N2)-methyltransferase